jgi:hypothetical protein
MKHGNLIVATVLLLFVSSVNAVVLDFEDLTATNDEINVGQNFVTSEITVVSQEYYLSSGVAKSDGYARIENGGIAGGGGNEIRLNNINLCFNFNTALDGLSLQYSEQGGNINLQINSILVNVNNFSNIPMNVGGVSVFSTSDIKGAFFAIGNIDSFAIGGQELWIDNIVASIGPYDDPMPIPVPIPEPMTVALLGLGGLLAARKKAKKALPIKNF